MAEATKPAAQTRRHRWLSLGGLDAAKAGLALYILGILTSGIHYARFHILALDFTKIQSIVVGAYVIGLYLAAPAGIVWCVEQVRIRRVVRLIACAVLLGGLDFGLLALLKSRWGAQAAVVSGTLILQLLLFVDWKSVWASVRDRKLEVELLHQPSREKIVALGVLVALHFSLFWFPRIPGNFAGGKPIAVQVFPKTEFLPDSRFVDARNKPQINTHIDAYRLQLLYQTDTDAYFLEDAPSDDAVVDLNVMRIARDEIARMDYVTSVWVSWR